MKIKIHHHSGTAKMLDGTQANLHYELVADQNCRNDQMFTPEGDAWAIIHFMNQALAWMWEDWIHCPECTAETLYADVAKVTERIEDWTKEVVWKYFDEYDPKRDGKPE